MSSRYSIGSSQTLSPAEMTALAEQAARIKQVQLSQSGLVILQALYGDILDINEEVRTDYKPGRTVDITMQLQAQVDPVECRLTVILQNQHLHEVVEGVMDPNSAKTSRLIREKMRLYIAYLYDNRFHWILLDPKQSFILPLEDHFEPNTVPYYYLHDNIEQRHARGEIPQRSLPSFDPESHEKLDAHGNPYIIDGETWEFDENGDELFQYQVTQEYIELCDHRPAFLYIEPRAIAYQREVKLQQQEEKKALVTTVLGVSAAALVVSQLLGFIDVKTWPGLSILFGSNKKEEQKVQV